MIQGPDGSVWGFRAKAALYDHLTQKKGMSKEEALDQISEEFVNYNRVSGRGRDFLESIGLLWFMNFKLRITKIAVKMVRDKPLSALMIGTGIEPLFGIDTVFGSSLPGAIVNGKMKHALGIGMGIRGLGGP